ncbi:MAG TPA: DUF5908 family protein [Chitinophagaceae bacterium]|nr:DUF5908 family protein [Chitinophagaceae bacterium]
MPVEIRELQITTVVRENASPQGSASSSTSPTSNTDSIVSACVEQVLEILKQKNER